MSVKKCGNECKYCVCVCVRVCVCVWGVWVCGPALTQVCVCKCDTVWLSVHMGEQG